MVLPSLIAILLSTLLSPVARRQERRGPRAGTATALTVTGAVLLFAGLWALIIPGTVSQGDELAARVQQGLGEVTDAMAPLGTDSRELDRAMDQGVEAARTHAVPGRCSPRSGPAIVLIVELMFCVIKDGRRLWCWLVELFHGSPGSAPCHRRRGVERPVDLHPRGCSSWPRSPRYSSALACPSSA